MRHHMVWWRHIRTNQTQKILEDAGVLGKIIDAGSGTAGQSMTRLVIGCHREPLLQQMLHSGTDGADVIQKSVHEYDRSARGFRKEYMGRQHMLPGAKRPEVMFMLRGIQPIVVKVCRSRL